MDFEALYCGTWLEYFQSYILKIEVYPLVETLEWYTCIMIRGTTSQKTAIMLQL